jgi:RimJ/RimL family protein N-acetyltransferase
VKKQEKEMLIENNELTIRAAKLEDAAILCQWWNDGKIMEHAGFPNGLNTTVEDIRSSLRKDNLERRRLILEHNNIPIGEMNYRKVEERVVQIGIKICVFDQQEKGYGTRFLKMLINYLFNDLHYGKIILDTNLKNTRAQHVYEKIGFKKIGVRYNAWNDQLGNPQSVVDYALCRQNYQF